MNDEEFQHLLNAKPPLVIKATKSAKKGTYAEVIFYCAVALVTVAFLAIQEMPLLLSLVIISPILIIGIGPGLESTNTAITLNRQDFSVKTFRKKQSHAWKDVTNFAVRNTRIASYITFNYVPKNYSCIVPLVDAGLGNKQLIQLMNYWRERALQQNS